MVRGARCAVDAGAASRLGERGFQSRPHLPQTVQSEEAVAHDEAQVSTETAAAEEEESADRLECRHRFHTTRGMQYSQKRHPC